MDNNGLSVSCMIIMVDLFEFDKLKKDDCFFFLNIISLSILVSNHGVQSIIGIILICLASLILLFQPIFHILCQLKDKRK